MIGVWVEEYERVRWIEREMERRLGAYGMRVEVEGRKMRANGVGVVFLVRGNPEKALGLHPDAEYFDRGRN